MGVKSKFSNTKASNLLKLLNDCEQFIVPPFQRNYAWTKETTAAMWDDLIDGFQTQRDNKEDDQEGDYLLGPIVLADSGENRYDIVDGQQRLSTITMMFCAARDIMLEYIHSVPGHKPEGYDKIKDMLENTNTKGERSSWKLTLNNTDKKLFQKIQKQVNPNDGQSKLEYIKRFKPSAKSHSLLVENYQFLYYKMLHAVCTDFDDGQDVSSKSIPEDVRNLVTNNIKTLNHFLTHVSRKNFVVRIVVKDNATAYQIFETLNYRGRELSKSDLIKNYVLSQIKNPTDQQELNNTWNTVLDGISNHNEADDVFIWESFRSRNYAKNYKIKNVSKKNLYNTIKKLIKNEEDAKRYVDELEEDAEFLTVLYDQDGYKDEDTKDDFRAIRALSAKNIRVPILTAYRKWYDKRNPDYNALVKFLVKYFFNVKIIQRIHAGRIEKKMSEIVRLIEEDAQLDEIITSLQENYDHKNFMSSFNEFLEPLPTVAKYILRQITIHLTDSNSIVKSLDSLTVEHILPKNVDEWSRERFFKNYPESNMKVKDFVNRIGNLTLLSENENKKNRNVPFPIKKEIYCKSGLAINSETVCLYDEWTAQTIKNRTNILAKHAGKIWNLK